MAIKQFLKTNKSKQEEVIHEIDTISKWETPNSITYYHHFWEEEVSTFLNKIKEFAL